MLFRSTEEENLQLREKIFFDTAGMSESNLQVLDLIINTLKHYEIRIDPKK